MTVSAVARLIPRPPARVDNRKQKSFKEITKPTVSSTVKLSHVIHCTLYVKHFFLILYSVRDFPSLLAEALFLVFADRRKERSCPLVEVIRRLQNWGFERLVFHRLYMHLGN